MKIFFVSLMLLFRTMYGLESSAFKYENSNLENIQEKQLSSNAVKQTDSSVNQNDFYQTLNNITAPIINNSDTATKKYVDYSDFMIDLSKTISSKLAEILRKKMKSLLNTSSLKDSIYNEKQNHLSRNSKQSSSKLNMENLGETSEKIAVSTSDDVPNPDFSKKMVESRQFLFHPYLPDGKETFPDEKISIHDVLPIKMVKFIKSMVEDAPWEQMFMKMVRMVVDQFVDKIIEKMFAHKEEDDHFRSMNDEKSSPWSLLKKSLIPVVRMRRSIAERKSEKEASWDSNSFSQSNRLSKNDDPKVKDASDDESWLDSVLDYLFPEGESEEGPEEYSHVERRKRDIENTKAIKQIRMEDIIHTFFQKYLGLSDGKNTPKEVQQMVRDSDPLQDIFESDNQLEVSNEEEPKKLNADLPSNGALSERWSKLLRKDQQTGSSEILKRTKRSVDGKEVKRLWQESPRSRPSSLKTRDECSLRKACNAGRLLSRLPSVQDLTLQLK